MSPLSSEREGEPFNIKGLGWIGEHISSLAIPLETRGWSDPESEVDRQ